MSAFLEACLQRLRRFPPPRRVPGEWAAPFQTALCLTCPPRLSLSPPSLSSSNAAFFLARATSFFCLFLPRARKPSTGFGPTRHQLFGEEGSDRRGELVWEGAGEKLDPASGEAESRVEGEDPGVPRCCWRSLGHAPPVPHSRAPHSAGTLPHWAHVTFCRPGADRERKPQSMFAAVQSVGFALGVGLVCVGAGVVGNEVTGWGRAGGVPGGNAVGSRHCSLQCGGQVNAGLVGLPGCAFECAGGGGGGRNRGRVSCGDKGLRDEPLWSWALPCSPVQFRGEGVVHTGPRMWGSIFGKTPNL